jgi:3-oxoacyl-[acyl-carrier protein] reductase
VRADIDHPHDLVGQVSLGCTEGGQFSAAIEASLAGTGVDIVGDTESGRCDALVFDASGLSRIDASSELYQFFHSNIARLQPNGRVVVLGMEFVSAQTKSQAILQYGLVGFIKSLAKELGRRGATANLLLVKEDVESAGLAAPLRFLLSRGSAFVDGQMIRVSNAKVDSQVSWSRPLEGKTALVTGAARGIGLAISQVLARDGARVIGIDVPAAKAGLADAMQAIDGLPLSLDITDSDAGEKIMQFCSAKALSLDIVVHNAGITRDKMLHRMSADQWQHLMQINLGSVLRINEKLLATEMLDQGGRIIGVASISGIAGNVGQTNYGFSKSAVIGMVKLLAEHCAARGITINAVAPGFIETEMTAGIPFMTRQFGRRLSSLSQGGLPVDVAEVIGCLASPQSASINGNVIRVCGQSIIGA